MKLINTSQLNAIFEDFEKSESNENFQEFAERWTDENKSVCIDTEVVSEFLEKSHDEDYKYLFQCEDDEFKWLGNDYLARLNFFRVLLGAKDDLTIENIKKQRKDIRVKYMLIELKTDGSYFEYIFEDAVRKRILCWEAIKYFDKIEQYLREHLFPEDGIYSRQQFLDDIKSASGYMRLKVERKETADFMCNMLYDLTEVE